MHLLLALGLTLVGCAEADLAAEDLELMDRCDDGRCADGPSCQAILDRSPDAPSGFYLLDPDGPAVGSPPFDALCEMDADEAWMVVELHQAEEAGWLSWEVIGPDGGSSFELLEGDELLFSPVGPGGCQASAVRAELDLPMTFTEWSGEWFATGLAPDSQHDDVHPSATWSAPAEDCGGHLRFGTAQRPSKLGGEWGSHWSATSPRHARWGWSERLEEPASTVRWEVADQGSFEEVVVYGLHLRLR